MPQFNTQSLNSDSDTTTDAPIDEVVSDFIDSTETLARSLSAPEETVSEFVESAEALADLVGETAETVEEVDSKASENTESIDELENELAETQEHTAKERAELSSRVSKIEDQVSEDESAGVDTGGTTIQPDELTPVEQLSRASNIGEVTDSPTVERAVSLFKNITDWGSRTPKGIVLKPADNPLSLLEADRDESLAWKQYYRAAEALERLSHGSVTFFDSDRHGKMLCLHEQSEAFERVVNGSLSSSSVEGTA